MYKGFLSLVIGCLIIILSVATDITTAGAFESLRVLSDETGR